MSFIQNLFTSRDNNANGANYVGQQSRIWWNPDTNAFYYSDGNTSGGILITGGSSGNGTVGGTNTQVQFNNAGNFAGDPNFTFNSATSTLTITNIVANTLTGGAGGANTQVQFNTNGNFTGTTNFTYNQSTNAMLMTGTATLGNVFPAANNVSNIGSPTNRFNDIWLGSGNINLIDDTLNINQEINAVNGNLVISGGNGLIFGQFAMFGNTISTINPTANINIGIAGSTGYVDIERPIAVNSTGGGAPAFVVEQNGTVAIFNANAAANTAGALNIVGSLDRAYQNVTNSGGMLHITGPGNSASRITVDAFGTTGAGSAALVAITGRAARGTASSPTQSLANDIALRIGAVSWKSTGGWTGSTVAGHTLDFVALEDATDASHATAFQFFNAAANGGYTRYQSAQIDSTGLSFLNNTTANSGITFTDGSFQNTAYQSTSVVRSLTAGAGISLSSNVGNITITNTGVLGIVGTTNQISITGNVGNVVTLGTPQDIGTTSNVQFYSLTVQNLSVLGNISNVLPSIVDGPVIYVANTATTYNDINNSGLSTGNVSNNYYASILYQTSSNTWQMDIGNSVGITASEIFAVNITANGNAHIGNASNDYDFPDALIQGDINIDSYGQFVLKNHSQTANASADIVAVPNNGDDGSYYIDMGINSNVYANVNYAVTGANDGYLYVNGGNLVIGTQTAAKVINFFTGGTNNLNKIRGTISDTGLSMVGNVTANNMISTNATIGGTVSALGNVTGGNLVSAGVISAAGNIQGLNVNTGIISASGNIRGGNLNTTGLVSTSGNIQAGNLLTTGLISSTGNISAANIAAGNITSGIISTTGNITGPNIIATILQVSTLLSVSGNIQGGNFLTDGLVSTTGNITGSYFLGNGSQLTGISVARISNGTSQINIPVASSNANITIDGASNVAVFATTGAYFTGVASATGNITGGNLTTAGRISATGNIVTGANLVTPNTIINSGVSTTGNVTGNYFIGNGAVLTGLNAYGNVFANGTAVLATTGSSTLTITPGNNQVITGNNTSKLVTIAVNDNPTFANLSVTGNITVFGNIFANTTTYLANVGNILFANTAPLPTAQPGVMEYDGRVLYFTPQDQERGIVPSQEWYVLNADRGLTYASTTPQSLFGVGAHVSNSTRYWFRLKATISRSAGTNNTALTLGWRGSAVLSKLNYTAQGSIGAVSTPTSSTTYETTLVAGFTVQTAVTGTNNPPDSTTLVIQGMIDVGATGAGYVEPFISWTGAVAPGSVTVSSLSYFQLFPLGVTGSNTSVGNWA